jgi:DtxR family Mn-dependent transcriptional regulator
MHPGTALIIGIVVLATVGLIFWPGKGLLSRRAYGRSNKMRVLLEDALKYIFDCEYKKRPCGLNGIAGNLHVSTDQATKIVDHLQSIGLIRLLDEEINLTDDGRSYALQIIRVHRIWERYLADETGVDHMEWHGAADFKEHRMSSEAANALAARIGNPVYDPHGDPIPSSEGELPSHQGQALSSLRAGDIARIVHIEDEPPAIYAQLSALDLFAGVQVYVLKVNDEKIEFVANGEECVLTPLFAANITVELLPQSEPIQERHALLSSLKLGEKAQIVGISPKCRGLERRRLMDMGIIPGSMVTAQLKSASGDPTAYQVMGTTVAIREGQAQNIFISPLKEENGQSE